MAIIYSAVDKDVQFSYLIVQLALTGVLYLVVCSIVYRFFLKRYNPIKLSTLFIVFYGSCFLVHVIVQTINVFVLG
jgi:hypothetical protein